MIHIARSDQVWTVCPGCETRNDLITHTSADGQESSPDDGAVIVCVYCGVISMFDHSAEGLLRLPTEEENRELIQNKDLMAAVVLVKRMQEEKMRTRDSFNDILDRFRREGM